MAPSLVDTLALEALHQSVFDALRGGGAPWFADVLRRPTRSATCPTGAAARCPP